MDSANLLLEVGAQAIKDLSAGEEAAILAKYANGQEALAGLHVFSLLTKKFKANYRMGRMYQNESQKYEAYRQIYYEYTRSVNAGKVKSQTATVDPVGRKFQETLVNDQ